MGPRGPKIVAKLEHSHVGRFNKNVILDHICHFLVHKFETTFPLLGALLALHTIFRITEPIPRRPFGVF